MILKKKKRGESGVDPSGENGALKSLSLSLSFSLHLLCMCIIMIKALGNEKAFSN